MSGKISELDISIFISNIILSMREFQAKNCIKNECLTNTQYLYDCIKINFNSANVKAKAVMVVSIESDTFICCTGHLILVLNDGIIFDPSYDIYSLKNKRYFYNIKDLISNIDDKNKLKILVDINELINNHLHFIKLAEQINNGACLISNKKFYNEQADYIDKLLK